MAPVSFSLGLTPHGRLVLNQDPDAPPLASELVECIRPALHRGSGHVLLLLGADEVGTTLPPIVSYWRDLGARYVTAVCTQQSRENGPRKVSVAPVPDQELERIASAAPPMTGGEYLTAAVLISLWQELDTAFGIELAECKCDVQEFLKRRNTAWNLVGRVHFNLAENRKDPDTPFAFLATYTSQLSAKAKAQHLPLGKALGEYAGAANKDRLLSLLVPVQRASENCPWLKSMVDAGEIFHPLRWTPAEALQLLRDVPRLEAAGVVVLEESRWLKVLSTLNEYQARLYVADRALDQGRGGISRLSKLTGMSRTTITKAAAELNRRGKLAEAGEGRIRETGGGRKKVEEADPGLQGELGKILERTTAGDPMSALRWTTNRPQRSRRN